MHLRTCTCRPAVAARALQVNVAGGEGAVAAAFNVQFGTVGGENVGNACRFRPNTAVFAAVPHSEAAPCEGEERSLIGIGAPADGIPVQIQRHIPFGHDKGLRIGNIAC